MIRQRSRVFDEPEDVGILARLARKEPASYVSIAMRPGGLQDYVDVWNELNEISKCEVSVGEIWPAFFVGRLLDRWVRYNENIEAWLVRFCKLQTSISD